MVGFGSSGLDLEDVLATGLDLDKGLCEDLVLHDVWPSVLMLRKTWAES